MQSRLGACFLRGTLRLFDSLDKEVLREIAKNSKVYKFSRKDRLSGEFPIEGKVYIVHEGCVFLSYMDENGKKIILDILSKGDIFGDFNFAGKRQPESESFFIEPFLESAVCEMKKDDFAEILKKNPEFAVSLLSILSQRLMSLEQRVGMLVFSDVEARLLAQMMKISKEFGDEDENKIHVGLRVTHERLAEMIGAARETVSETISNLRNKGVLSQDKRRKFVLHKDKIDSLY